MLIIFLGTLLVSLALGLPVAFSLILTGAVMMARIGLFNSQVIAQQMLSGLNSFSLLAIPFFVLSGEAMNKGGISEAIVDAVLAVFGHIRGALGYVAIFSSIIFAGLSGSAIADTAALGGVLIPMMQKDGYDKGRSTGLVVCSAIIANIIPPSIGFILYGVISGTSITSLFIGGLIPGIIIGLSLTIVWYFVAKHDKLVSHATRLSKKEAAGKVSHSIPALVLPVFILVGLRFGVFTPTEAGSIAAVYALIVGLFVYRKIKFKDIPGILRSATKTTAQCMLIVAGALVVSWVIIACKLSASIVESFSFLVAHPKLFVLVCQIIFLIFGMVMDLGPIVMIMVPVLLPLVKAAGIDTTYFGILMIINLTFGLVTPPVGNVLYVGTGISGASIGETIRGAAPFMITEIILIVLFTFIPSLILTPLGWLT